MGSSSRLPVVVRRPREPCLKQLEDDGFDGATLTSRLDLHLPPELVVNASEDVSSHGYNIGYLGYLVKGTGRYREIGQMAYS